MTSIEDPCDVARTNNNAMYSVIITLYEYTLSISTNIGIGKVNSYSHFQKVVEL